MNGKSETLFLTVSLIRQSKLRGTTPKNVKALDESTLQRFGDILCVLLDELYRHCSLTQFFHFLLTLAVFGKRVKNHLQCKILGVNRNLPFPGCMQVPYLHSCCILLVSGNEVEGIGSRWFGRIEEECMSMPHAGRQW